MERNIDRATLTGFLTAHAAGENVSFHMPGHKGRRLFDEAGMGPVLDRLADMDITEIEGADNLFEAESVIRSVMDRYRALYRAKESFLLVGGSSAGILAAIMTAVPRGGKMIIASNCHKSAVNGMLLAGAVPHYVSPALLPEAPISGPVTPEAVERAVREVPEAKAVYLTSPNYYGIMSDIPAIAEIAHRAGMALIVDQAHGAHLTLMGDPYDACAGGADAVIMSTHKTLASFTQTAVACLYGDRIDADRFAECLQMIESSSPSYILMASLDLNAALLEERGEALTAAWREELARFYGAAEGIEGLKVLRHPMHDLTKINMDMSALGLTGLDLSAALRDYGIFTELEVGTISMGMTGIGNRREDYDRLLAALADIAEQQRRKGAGPLPKEEGTASPLLYEHRNVTAIPESREKVHWTEAAGRISAMAVIPYPPGIPLLVPGEVMDEEALAYAASLRAAGVKVIGIDAQGFVFAGKK